MLFRRCFPLYQKGCRISDVAFQTLKKARPSFRSSVRPAHHPCPRPSLLLASWKGAWLGCRVGEGPRPAASGSPQGSVETDGLQEWRRRERSTPRLPVRPTMSPGLSGLVTGNRTCMRQGGGFQKPDAFLTPQQNTRKQFFRLFFKCYTSIVDNWTNL